jgi:hypothetical protein
MKSISKINTIIILKTPQIKTKNRTELTAISKSKIIK